MKIREMSKHIVVIDGLTKEQVVNYIKTYLAYNKVIKGSGFVKYYLHGILVAERLWNAGTYTLALY